ncbi:TetR/AcrR family transcriptional regulator [Diaphorobacter sp. HDW4B]|uniref:TetR/AcrR family transcriptional regulator n=1 Tax=Diaphorobacter sp. HDW4B TaxID=2714925 RepID=UPI00140D645A|nr:TetR/AcrR family transcriptional regulator [Diaphorobacter sp. HDW4B]QIL72085.1 TetR/AcrR family transcriptional regulator [Diaphorobacter sp. HDW4B]
MAYRQTPAIEAKLQDNKTRILKAARALVSEGGWQEAQIANVATTAGIATGTVYRYFPSKAELFADVLSRVSQREVDVLTDIAASDASTQERIHSMVTTFVIRAMRNPRLAYALIAEPCDKAIDEVRLQYRAAISEVIRGVIEAGQTDKRFRNDVRADIAATVIVGGFMEGLIGPLSPLANTAQMNEADQRVEIETLANQIAALACSSIAAKAG